MPSFCDKLKDLAEGFYVKSEALTNDLYGIHNKNRIGDKPIFCRSCQLRRVDNTMIEIFVAAPLFADDYLFFQDTIIILACLNRDCKIETTANIFQFSEKYQKQLTSM